MVRDSERSWHARAGSSTGKLNVRLDPELLAAEGFECGCQEGGLQRAASWGAACGGEEWCEMEEGSAESETARCKRAVRQSRAEKTTKGPGVARVGRARKSATGWRIETAFVMKRGRQLCYD